MDPTAQHRQCFRTIWEQTRSCGPLTWLTVAHTEEVITVHPSKEETVKETRYLWNLKVNLKDVARAWFDICLLNKITLQIRGYSIKMIRSEFTVIGPCDLLWVQVIMKCNVPERQSSFPYEIHEESWWSHLLVLLSFCKYLLHCVLLSQRAVNCVELL